MGTRAWSVLPASRTYGVGRAVSAIAQASASHRSLGEPEHRDEVRGVGDTEDGDDRGVGGVRSAGQGGRLGHGRARRRAEDGGERCGQAAQCSGDQRRDRQGVDEGEDEHDRPLTVPVGEPVHQPAAGHLAERRRTAGQLRATAARSGR
ncbi:MULTISPECIES: hypothetical protein [unclassified Streptomyces]|uniref:hypothetical protein n=1 Tax=unclassified Streptomyces TaxID=2593676 RepID=UPI0036ECE603